MEKIRGFEIVSKYKNKNVALPRRQTIASAGYDLAAAKDVLIPSIWRLNFVRIFRLI
ncbi:MAG: dUTP diphosphatase, partial [Lactobacillus sp.]|nr:dUTP diphosphatase [Lactobacillus sp.]